MYLSGLSRNDSVGIKTRRRRIPKSAAQSASDDWELDNLKEECGIFWHIRTDEEVARIPFLALRSSTAVRRASVSPYPTAGEFIIHTCTANPDRPY